MMSNIDCSNALLSCDSIKKFGLTCSDNIKHAFKYRLHVYYQATFEQYWDFISYYVFRFFLTLTLFLSSTFYRVYYYNRNHTHLVIKR